MEQKFEDADAEADQKQLEAMEMNRLRWSYRVCKQEKVIREDTIVKETERRQLIWYGVEMESGRKMKMRKTNLYKYNLER